MRSFFCVSSSPNLPDAVGNLLHQPFGGRRGAAYSDRLGTREPCRVDLCGLLDRVCPGVRPAAHLREYLAIRRLAPTDEHHHVEAACEFRQVLFAVRYLPADRVVDVHLPRIGGPNLFGASGRGSEFPVRLRGAITPPEGYTVYYTTSDAVYTHSMEEMVSADIWAATVSDYASVTAFKLVAGDGTELAGNSRFQVRIPVCAPKTFDEDSMALLHAKVDQDQASGTVSWLQAVNAFGFRTVQTPTVKGSNTVWARVCFAGFCVKKVNGATQAALPGAFLLLSAAALPDLRERRSRKH